MVWTLLILMMVDFVSGLLAAFVSKTLSSTVSWAGIGRKALTLLVIAGATLVEPLVDGVPVSRLVTTFYLVSESLSILENAARAGVPIPQVLKLSLAKTREAAGGDQGNKLIVPGKDE